MWDRELMEMACREVQEGRLSIRRALEAYQVPRSTLSDHVTGKVSEGSHSGPTRYLTDEEEAELVNFFGWVPMWGMRKNWLSQALCTLSRLKEIEEAYSMYALSLDDYL